MTSGQTIMKLFFACLLVLACTAALGAPQEAQKWQGWIPSGWKLIHTATGDLNNDGRSDAVLIIEQDYPRNRKPNTGLGEPVLNTNPRHLLILFNTPAGFKLTSSVDHFLPGEGSLDSPCLGDPLDNGGASVKRGLLQIDLHYWLSCGSYAVNHQTLLFRHEGGRFRLIGRDAWDFMRNSGERSEVSINYLTGKRKTTTGLNEFDKSSPKVVWDEVRNRGPFFLDAISSECPAEENSANWCL